MWLNFTLFQQIVQDAEETARQLSSDGEAQQEWARSRPERERQGFFLIRSNTPASIPWPPMTASTSGLLTPTFRRSISSGSSCRKCFKTSASRYGSVKRLARASAD